MGLAGCPSIYNVLIDIPCAIALESSHTNEFRRPAGMVGITRRFAIGQFRLERHGRGSSSTCIWHRTVSPIHLRVSCTQSRCVGSLLAITKAETSFHVAGVCKFHPVY